MPIVHAIGTGRPIISMTLPAFAMTSTSPAGQDHGEASLTAAEGEIHPMFPGQPQRSRASGLGFVSSLTLVAVLVFASCTYTEPSLSGKYDILYSQPTDTTDPTGGILLLSDNHIHYLFGDATFLRTNWTDAEISPSAIRPPQLDLFGQDFLRRIFEREQATEALIHLGDSLDVGCRVEWDQFMVEMKAWPGPWVMAPGNHDIALSGNFTSSSSLGSWRAACANGGELMSKNRFVALYLEALGAESENVGLMAAVRATPNAGRWRCTGACKTFLQEVVWSIDQVNPWRSYVVQRVNLGYCRKRLVPEGTPESCTKPIRAIDGILLDTATYEEAVGVELKALTYAAGKFGDVGAAQVRVVQEWLTEDSTSKVPVVIMGHHEYQSLSKDARAVIDAAIRMGSPFYVSGHTHQGGYFVHGKTDTGWLELNLGSVLDWRPHYRRLQFFDRAGRLGARAWYRTVEDLIDDCPVQNAWEPSPEAPDFFERYTKMTGLKAWERGEAQLELADMILAALDRMFLCVPLQGSGREVTDQQCATTSKYHDRILTAETDPSVTNKLALARELMAVVSEKDNFENPKLWTRYRLCEALWASKYERDRARVPVIEDEYFLLPSGGKK